MLESDEYEQIRRDYDDLSSKWYPKSHRPPDDLRFNESAALFPAGNLRDALATDYREQCELLFPGDYVSFDQAVGTFEQIRELL